MMGTMGAASMYSKASSGEVWDQGTDQGKISKLARTPGNSAAQGKDYYARDHNLESMMDVEVPVTLIKKERKAHMKKVTDEMLEQQCEDKLKLQKYGLVPNSQYNEDEVMSFIWEDRR
jgi:hypothetical protein